MVGKINFVGVKTEFEPIPNGAYESEFKDYKFGKVATGKNQGADKVDLQYAVTEEGDYKNRRLFRTCTFTQESLYNFKKAMVVLGSEVDWDSPDGLDVEAICREVRGRKCIVKVSIRDYEDPKTGENRPQNQIDGFEPTEAYRAELAEARAQQVLFSNESAEQEVAAAGKARK